MVTKFDWGDKISKTKEVKKITVELIFGWLFGILFLLLSMSWFSSSFLKGLTFFVMGFVLLPPINSYFRNKYNFELSGGAKVMIIIVGFIILFLIPQTNIVDSTISTLLNYEEKISEGGDEVAEKAGQLTGIILRDYWVFVVLFVCLFIIIKYRDKIMKFIKKIGKK